MFVISVLLYALIDCRDSKDIVLKIKNSTIDQCVYLWKALDIQKSTKTWKFNQMWRYRTNIKERNIIINFESLQFDV